MIGVWKLNYPNSNLCLVFINQNFGAFTDTTGLLHYYFNYQISSSNEEPMLVSEYIPIYSDKKDYYKCLIQLKNDSTLLLNNEITGKDVKLMQGKSVSVYNKLIDVNAESFIRKPNQQDLIGNWLSIYKKDTTVLFTFKTNNIVEVTNYITKKISFGLYNLDCKNQPMSINITNDKGEVQPYIFVFIGTNGLRLAGPKRGERRTQFTAFGNNHFLTKELLKSN